MTSGSTQTQPIGKYVRINDIDMYYEIHGSGYPLVLLHGGGSTIHTTFGSVIPALAKMHQVIAVELQAHGHTGDRDAQETFEQDAADVIELLRQLNIPKANIFGFSNGGQTAMELGIKYPQKVNKLIIASAFYKRDGVPAGFWGGFDSATLNNMPQVYQDGYLRITNDRAGLQNMFEKDVQRMRTFKDWKEEDIRSIQAPSLIVIGNQDMPLPEHAVEMHRLIPNSSLAILPGTHGSYMGEAMMPDVDRKLTDFFVAIVDEFLISNEYIE